MSALFVWIWIVGAAPAAVLGELVASENPRTARLARIGFALLLGLDLLLAAVVFSAGSSNPDAILRATSGQWWLATLLGGVPLVFVSGLAVRRGYEAHRPALGAALLTTAALYFAFPLGYHSPLEASQLTGLPRFEHYHHVLDVLILLVPALILLADEFRRRGEEPSATAPAPLSRKFRLRVPRGFVGAGIAVLVLAGWLAGENIHGQLLSLGVVLGVWFLFLLRKHRADVRRVTRELNPPEGPT